MEFLTEAQMQKYHKILDKINKCFEESKKLEEDLEKENNKYILTTLAKNSEILHGLSKVNVKIFSNIVDLFNLYQDDLNSDIRDFLMLRNCNFYLIEVHLSKDLLQKLRGLDWFVNVSVKYDNMCVSRTIKLKKKLPIYEVIPINEDVIGAVVESRLFLNLQNECIQLKLEEVCTNISYHLATMKTQCKNNKQSEKILELRKLYKMNFNTDFLKLSNVDYTIPFSLDVARFIAGFIKNCYHNVDIQLLTELENGNKNKFDFLVISKREVYSIAIEKNKINIRCNYQDMALLKKYFAMVFPHSQKGDVSMQDIIKMKNSTVVTPSDIKEFYLAVRNISQNITS